jgi:hypothetical protein
MKREERRQETEERRQRRGERRQKREERRTKREDRRQKREDRRQKNEPLPMKKILAVLISFSLLAPGARAQAPNTLTKKEKKQGWKLLFDGKTTKGWHTYLRDTVGSKWQVKEGSIIFDPTKPNSGGGDIVTNDEYENFDFRLEWKVEKGSNSGIIFDIQEKNQPGYRQTYESGPEMQVLDNIDAQDNKPETHLAGCLYDMAGSAAVSKPKPVGQWNQVRILQDKGHLTFWLNDIKTFEGQIGSEEWKAMVAKSKFGNARSFPNFAKVAKGKIALQQHPGSSAWRNIKIRIL